MASKWRWMMIPPSVVLMRLANDYVEFGEELKIEIWKSEESEMTIDNAIIVVFVSLSYLFY